ncbi:hypothetical protein VULLAG_LOCUS5490 [Vulpes lagopus]
MDLISQLLSSSLSS